MNYYERALELKDETIANRRHIHKNAETGLDLPKTKAYVMEKLTEYGLEPKDCGYGGTATHCKKAEKNLHVLQEKKHIHADMISTLQCFLQQQRC